MLMNTRIFIIMTVFILGLGIISAWSQENKLVQVTGVAKMQDSSDVIPYMGVYVIHKGVGTLTNENGVFSLVCEKGDTLVFNALGFEKKELVIPRDLPTNFYTTTQYFVQDTFYLQEAYVRPYLSAEEFDFVMRYRQYDDNIYDLANANTSREVLDMLLRNLPKDGRENVSYLQMQQAIRATYYNQQAPIGIFNPFAWGSFFKSLQNGDYRKK